MMKQRTTSAISLASAVVLLSGTALAGGPLNLNPNDPDGVERWPNGGVNIPFNPDGVPAGGTGAPALGPFTYAEAVNETVAAVQAWQAIPSASNTYSNNGAMPFDIDVTNFAPFVDNLFNGANTADGFSPVVYDVDGSIFVALFGVSGVLGFASTDTRDAAGTPIEAVCFLNGGAIVGGGGTFPVADFLGVIVHEFGHYSGLAHTVVNGQNVGLADATGPSPNNTYGDSPTDQVETMYPFALQGGGQITPHADDIGIMSFLYPEPTFFADSGTIQGTIFASNGTTPLTGVNVIARNVADPFVDAVSSISGDRGVTGVYTINGLTPGAEYTVHIDQIQQGGFSTPPAALPGPEEFFNGANESDNPEVDDPAESTTVTPVAGSPTTGIDVVFNGRAPGDLGLGDDDSAQVFLPFPFQICGTEFDSVFVNSNGSVTFGFGDTDFSESAIDMLLGPPRIAGVWDDLNPTTGGSITVEDGGDTFTIKFENVPEFFSTGANTFSIVLKDERGAGGVTVGNTFEVIYGGVSATDGLAGFSCGFLAATGIEPSDDISELTQPIDSTFAPAVYEVFTLDSPNDLANSTLEFGPTTTFCDAFEPNDTFRQAQNFAVPENTSTVDMFTSIDPLGDDVDFYRVSLGKDTTFIAEVTGGAIDSVMGLFRKRKGQLEQLAFDDDGGNGVLSKIVFPVEKNGKYFLAVSTFPDTDFTGDGASGGRYVLDFKQAKGTPITLGDDDSVEVEIPFHFEFQGEIYESVFVNSNGNLTFGEGSTDFTESVTDLLSGPPRIAPLWDDLSPNQGGTVTVDVQPWWVVVTFTDVPEFFATTGNTFQLFLWYDGTIEINYGGIAAIDGLVGITEGGGTADVGPTDLSESDSYPAVGTTYEAFGFGNENDLSNTTLFFVP